MKRTVARVIAGMLLTFLTAIALFLGVAFGTVAETVWRAESAQRARVRLLARRYADPAFQPTPEQNFCDFDLGAAVRNGTRLVDLQMLATHNSYKSEKSWLEKLCARASDGLAEGNYAYAPPSRQLDAGVRSLEYDLFYARRGGQTAFYSFHIGFLDMSSHAFDFALALEELDLWSRAHPDHVPVTVLLEVKTEGAMLPYRCMSAAQLPALQALIREKVSTLYTPADAIGSCRDLNEARYLAPPTLADTQGKILFVLHAGDLTAPLLDRDPTLSEAALFPSSYFWWDGVTGRQQFVVLNNRALFDPRALQNAPAADGYYVRAMLDDPSAPPSERFVRRALNTGVNLLSTHFPPGAYASDAYSVWLGQKGVTIHLRTPESDGAHPA